jgi:hypothetical protein
MTTDEKIALRQQFPEHAFVRAIHPLGECIIALPKAQSTPEKIAAVELMHGSTITLT